MQGGTNMKIKQQNGVCIEPTEVTLGEGDVWTGVAAQVVARAGRRRGVVPPPANEPEPIAVSPPINDTKINEYIHDLCVHFAALPCNTSKPSQRWILSDQMYRPGQDSQPTTIRSVSVKQTNASCWTTNNCGWGGAIAVFGEGSSPKAEACQPLPPAGWQPNASAHGGCDDTYPQAFILHANGTISLAMRPSACAQISIDPPEQMASVQVAQCSNWKPTPAPAPPHPPSPPHPPPPPAPPAPPPSKNCVFRKDTDYNGGGMGSALTSASPEVCCAQCAAAKGCAFGVWLMNANLPQCYLKTKAAKPYSRAGRTSCGVKEPTITRDGGTQPTATLANQTFEILRNQDGTFTFKQGSLCIDNNFKP
jgi:hypothetical protein